MLGTPLPGYITLLYIFVPWLAVREKLESDYGLQNLNDSPQSAPSSIARRIETLNQIIL